jgi:hypothetical protein
VWAAIRDVGALHKRLAPGFVVDTKLEAGARIVTFANGMVVREPIVTVDDAAMRLVWSAEGGVTTHRNSSVQAIPLDEGAGTRVVWLTDFLPDLVALPIGAAMDAGMLVVKMTLDRLAEK